MWWRAAALRAFAKLDREACGTLGAADVVAYCRSHANGLFLGAQQPLLADRGSPLARGVERALVAAEQARQSQFTKVVHGGSS